MKLVSKFLNLLLFMLTFCLITVAEWGVYNLVAMPADDSKIAITSNDENVAYTDTFRFLVDDLKQSVTREPRYLVRSWFKWDWWTKSMKYVDLGVEAVVGVVVPIFSPMYEVSEIKYYYSEFSQTQLAECNEELTENRPSSIINNSVAGYGIVNLKDYVNEEINYIASSPDWDNYTVREEYLGYRNIFVYYEYVDEGQPSGGKLYKITNANIADKDCRDNICKWEAVDEICEPTGSWLVKDNNKTFINMVLKINKYNNPDRSYNTWINKFYNTDNMVIKTSVVSLYFQFYMAILMSAWFIYQNPIRIKRSDDGMNEVSGGLHWNRRKHRRKKEKRKDEKAQ